MIRCLVFDFDGVLVDSNEVKRDAFFRVFQGLGDVGHGWIDDILARDTDSDRFQIIGAIVDRARSAGLIGPAVSRSELIGDYALEYNRICEAYATTCPEIAGAGSAISALAHVYPLYIISATPAEPLRRIVSNRGWSNQFKGVFGRPGTKLQHLVRVIDDQAVDPSEVVFVGDGRRDLEAARSAGCHFVGIRNAFNDFETSGLCMLDDLRDLLDTIQSLDAQLAAS